MIHQNQHNILSYTVHNQMKKTTIIENNYENQFEQNIYIPILESEKFLLICS